MCALPGTHSPRGDSTPRQCALVYSEAFGRWTISTSIMMTQTDRQTDRHHHRRRRARTMMIGQALLLRQGPLVPFQWERMPP